MKRYSSLIFVCCALAFGMAATSFAQDGESDKPRTINERQQNQRDRIKDGVQDGELTKKETARLLKEQQQIRKQERRFRSDGDFTGVERAKVQRNLNQSNRHIRRAKRN